MTATVEQTHSELLRLIGLAQKGEEVVIVNQGHPLAKLTALPENRLNSNRQTWLAKLADLRAQVARVEKSPALGALAQSVIY
jgi:antitoxin (DNA-binding transcriptional repressor) of toxin-antitoxin stability system